MCEIAVACQLATRVPRGLCEQSLTFDYRNPLALAWPTDAEAANKLAGFGSLPTHGVCYHDVAARSVGDHHLNAPGT